MNDYTPSLKQFLVIERLINRGGTMPAEDFKKLCGYDRVVRSMFSHGLVTGDQVPAQNVSLTQAARDAFDKAKRTLRWDKQRG